MKFVLARRLYPWVHVYPMAEQAFGERLRALREQTEYSQRGLSRAAGLSEGLVRHYETGRLKSPSGEVSKKLARILKVKLEELLGGTEEAPIKRRASKRLRKVKA